MADDWKPGDLALCVNTNPETSGKLPLESIRKGGLYTVERTSLHPLGVILILKDVVPDTLSGGFGSFRFRKINPHTPDAEDAETIRLLTGKPMKVRA